VKESGGTVRAVVADDSAVMRRLVDDALASTGEVEVVAHAVDGADAIARCDEHEPDVLTLDLAMPGTNGLDVLAHLRRTRSPVRVVVVSSFSQSLVERALDVLDAGAIDLVAKPKVGESLAAFSDDVGRTVLAVARGARSERPQAPARIAIPSRSATPDAGRILAIACSTGGPRALGELVPRLPLPTGAGAIVVQHMPEGFTGPLARRLDRANRVEVREAADGDRLAGDRVLIAPAGWHTRISTDGAVNLDSSAPIGGLRPRADLTIVDLAAWAGPRVVLVVLTGMGSDALDGARAVRAAGGIVLTQDESDCVVYGMPRNVVEHDLADAVGTLTELPVLIERALGTPVVRAR
jgi:two-component system chemotaxis response regulator CheB